jgi:hypothetical protein
LPVDPPEFSEFGRPARTVLTFDAKDAYAMRAAGKSTRTRSALAGAALLAAFSGAAAGCFDAKRPTQVMVTQVAPAMHPAKPPDCNMPVLTSEPTVGYQQIAIVEAWADINEDPAAVLPELKRKACGTGAEALLILSGKKQDADLQLYSVTPNENETAVTAANRSPNQSGDYVNKMQYRPKVGEEGHTGYYINGIAIDYASGTSTAATGQPSTP